MASYHEAMSRLTDLKTVSASLLNLLSSVSILIQSLLLLTATGGVGSLHCLGNRDDQWGEWTAPTPSLRVAEA